MHSKTHHQHAGCNVAMDVVSTNLAEIAYMDQIHIETCKDRKMHQNLVHETKFYPIELLCINLVLQLAYRVTAVLSATVFSLVLSIVVLVSVILLESIAELGAEVLASELLLPSITVIVEGNSIRIFTFSIIINNELCLTWVQASGATMFLTRFLMACLHLCIICILTIGTKVK